MVKRIAALAQRPPDPDQPDKREKTARQLNGYTTDGFEVECIYPEDTKGAKVFLRLGESKEFNGVHHAMHVPVLIKRTVKAEEEGFDALIQTCTFDPGVEECRLAVDMPVVGLFKSTLHVAATLADRIGVLVPLGNHVPYTWSIARRYGMDEAITDIRPLETYGQLAELEEIKDDIASVTIDAINTLVEETEAEVVIPLGGLVFPRTVPPEELREHVDVPVLNTNVIGIRFAELYADAGLAQSPLKYPKGDLDYDDYDSYAWQ